jgi:Holliday junction resolvase RusA-like endonuclease
MRSIRHALRIHALRENVSIAPVSDRAFTFGVHFVFRRPKSHVRANGELRSGAPLVHTQRPDADNLLKAVQDALGSFRKRVPLVWADDSQIVSVDARKRWCALGEESGALIRIEMLAP